MPAQEVRALLVARKQLQAKMRDVELSLRGLLRGFGLKVGEISKGQWLFSGFGVLRGGGG
jgi:transposase